MELQAHFRGSLLGLACGDAVCWTVEFELLRRHDRQVILA